MKGYRHFARFQMKKKEEKKVRIKLGNVLRILLFWFVGYITIIFFDTAYTLCFSQEYHKMENVESIVFKSWDDKYYQRFFWGLGTVKMPENLYRNEFSWEELQELEDEIKPKNRISEAVYSTDGNYILYCEIERVGEYAGDEHCYYRVYNKKTGEIITIYDAYKEWYELYWK